MNEDRQWRHRITKQLPAAVRRLVDLVAGCNDATAVPATPSWTVHDVIAHLAVECERYVNGARGRAEPAANHAAVIEFNDRVIHENRSVPFDQLLISLVEGADVLCSVILDHGADQPDVPFDGGQSLPADKTLGVLLGEVLVHGSDVARALGERWEIGADEVCSVLDALLLVAGGWTSPAARGHNATYEMRVRGSDHRHAVTFVNGELRQAAPGAKRDVVISGTPAPLLLVFYGRMSPIRPALTGQLLGWGRRPWLGLSLSRRFLPP